MLPSHLAIGVLLCSPFYIYAPSEIQSIVLITIVVGSVSPDVDMLVGQHRKTTHYPEISTIVALGCTVLIPADILFYIPATFTTAFALHAWIDIFGGGLEDKPWEKTSTQAVYRHLSNKWEAPRHYTGHDGSYRDLIATLLATVAIYTIITENWFTAILLINLTIAILYTIVRKRLPALRDKILSKYPRLTPLLRQV